MRRACWPLRAMVHRRPVAEHGGKLTSLDILCDLVPCRTRRRLLRPVLQHLVRRSRLAVEPDERRNTGSQPFSISPALRRGESRTTAPRSVSYAEKQWDQPRTRVMNGEGIAPFLEEGEVGFVENLEMVVVEQRDALCGIRWGRAGGRLSVGHRLTAVRGV